MVPAKQRASADHDRPLHRRTALARVAALLELLENPLQREARRLLARRILPERGQELAHVDLRRHHEEDPIDEPVVVGVGRLLRTLVRIAPQVEQQRVERLARSEEEAMGKAEVAK